MENTKQSLEWSGTSPLAYRYNCGLCPYCGRLQKDETMNKFDWAVEALKAGYYYMKVFGNSMTPLIESGSRVALLDTKDYKVGDVVICKVKGNWLVHKITKIAADGRYMISNNKGYDNGWTKKVYGRVVEVNGKPFGRPIG